MSPAEATPVEGTSVIRFTDVHRHFGTQPVLRGLSFAVAPGEVYAFLGRNGAGKTTALRILLGFLAPHRGSAGILGTDSQRLGPAQRARIGYVGEGHRLYPLMRVVDAVAFEAGTRPAFRRDFADAAVQRCGLRRGQVVARLSRGQRAQLALILAVASRPEVLVFDDPAMGLDVVMRREFLDAMIDLLAGSGCTVLFSSHVLTDVERIADRVGILHEGRMLVDARLDDLKARVRRCRWTPANGQEPPAADDRLLRVGRRRDGFELTLLDADAAMLARLRANGRLGELLVPTLEELFLDLTGPDRPGLLSEPAAMLAAEPREGPP
jgi:ABC-2 type transport system ATP-binding protein